MSPVESSETDERNVSAPGLGGDVSVTSHSHSSTLPPGVGANSFPPDAELPELFANMDVPSSVSEDVAPSPRLPSVGTPPSIESNPEPPSQAPSVRVTPALPPGVGAVSMNPSFVSVSLPPPINMPPSIGLPPMPPAVGAGSELSPGNNVSISPSANSSGMLPSEIDKTPSSTSELRHEQVALHPPPPPPGLTESLGEGHPVSVYEKRVRRINLQLEASRLPSLDVHGKLSLFVVYYRRVDTPGGDEWECVGQTETISNNSNPKWATLFTTDYRFGMNPVLKFAIYNSNSESNDPKQCKYIGEVQCTVAQAFLAENNRLCCPIRSSKAAGSDQGVLIVRVEEQKGDLGETITFIFAVSKLRKGRKPFYVLSRKNRNDKDFAPVISSEVLKGYTSRSNQPTAFQPFTESIARVVNNDHDRELRIEIFDYDRRGNHYRGGSTTFTLRSVRDAMHASAHGNASFTLKKIRSSGQTINAGILTIKRCDLTIPYSFLDYLNAGVTMNTVIAVDMSNTNGDPQSPSSLHYNNKKVENDYVIALREVGRVLTDYTTTKSFPTFGFGAVIPPNRNETSHCFALTGDFQEPLCYGIADVISRYYSALSQVGPYEPCYYGPVLEHVIQLTRSANESVESPVYTILLLVTDGDFSDFDDVATLICGAADLPLSIVIVGVGNSDFVKLERLDGDRDRLCSPDGTPCARDIVQFVRFHQHRYNPTQLAREVLDEIPDQLVSYMRSHSIKPSDIVPAKRNVPRSPHRPGPYFPEQRKKQPTSKPVSSASPPSSFGSIPAQTSTPPSLHAMPSVSTVVQQQSVVSMRPPMHVGYPAQPNLSTPMTNTGNFSPMHPPVNMHNSFVSQTPTQAQWWQQPYQHPYQQSYPQYNPYMQTPQMTPHPQTLNYDPNSQYAFPQAPGSTPAWPYPPPHHREAGK